MTFNDVSNNFDLQNRVFYKSKHISIVNIIIKTRQYNIFLAIVNTFGMYDTNMGSKLRGGHSAAVFTLSAKNMRGADNRPCAG